MSREWVARSAAGQEELHLVLIEDNSPEADPPCQLIVTRHHLSRDREPIAGKDFADLAQAQDYCLKEYGVARGDWKHEITLSYTFEFNYTVSNCGIPQPCPVASPDARIVFRLSPIEDEIGGTRAGLNICGTRDGLKRLAAMLILSAESDKYDPEFHVHLEDQQGVEADMDVTIRAPVYLDKLRSGKFSEFKGTPINIDDTGDSSPNDDQPQTPPTVDKPRRSRLLSATIRNKSMTATESQPAEPKLERRWYQFSLAGLLALMAIISLGLSLLKWSVDALPFVATLLLWMVTMFVDRRFSPRLSERPAAIAVALVLLGFFSACIVLAGRFFLGI